MNKELNIFIFKRDLRVEDNRTLYECFKNSDKFIPIFIFNPDIISNFRDKRLSFIVDIILNLRKKLNLYVFKGTDEEVITRILQKYSVKKIFTSLPLTKSGKKRNNKLLEFSKSRGIEFVEVFDNVLVDFTKINFKKVYSHFYNEWKKNLDLKTFHEPDYNLKVQYDQEFEESTLSLLRLFDTVPKTIWDYNFGMNRIKSYNFYKYSDLRNNLSEDYSSKLSPYIRFGVISIRKLYELAFDKSEDFIKELAWREFFYHIAYNFAELDELEFQEKRRGMNWENNEKYIESFF
ncbi:MAG: deoxyribodipyrimidine photo-lyase, partial [Candidatus Calescibacterium sp.]|nr:deoxyribodipyrimidine photo-lyase [Candidatus Calescibacterium sp.]